MDPPLPLIEMKESERCELCCNLYSNDLRFTSCSLRPKRWYHFTIQWQRIVQISQKATRGSLGSICGICGVCNGRSLRFNWALGGCRPPPTAHVTPGSAWLGISWLPNSCLTYRGSQEIRCVSLQNNVQNGYAVSLLPFLWKKRNTERLQKSHP